MTLRSRLIRLAHADPALRPHLLPVLLRTAAVPKIALRKTQLSKLMSRGGKFGIISAYTLGSKKANKRRHVELVLELQNLGYRRVETSSSSWEYEGGVKKERSLLIPNIKPSDLFKLGTKYKQEAVIYKSHEGVLGMYFTIGPPKAKVAVDVKGDPGWLTSVDPVLYSKTRGLSFEFDFLWEQDLPWDGNKPITKKQLRQWKANGKIKFPLPGPPSL